MKHIDTLFLENFQQWKSGEIKFKDGLNVIVGNTECGKSTLFRAINSILTGKMPEDYIRKGEKGCAVKIKFSDGTVFRRTRNKKDNIVDANGLIFERVGKEIPFEYFNKLGKTSIEFGTKELSLCSYSQFEPHFFITLSDYDKSKLIGTICGIDIVDKLMDAINKDIRKANTNIKFLDEQIAEKTSQKEEKEKLLVNAETKVKTLEPIVSGLENSIKTLENLSNLSSALGSVGLSINAYESQLKAITGRICQFNTDAVKKLEHLEKLASNLHTVDIEISTTDDKMSKLKTDMPISTEKVGFLDDMCFLREKLAIVNAEILSKTSNLSKYNTDLKQLEETKSNLLKGFDKCPLCGGIL